MDLHTRWVAMRHPKVDWEGQGEGHSFSGVWGMLRVATYAKAVNGRSSGASASGYRNSDAREMQVLLRNPVLQQCNKQCRWLPGGLAQPTFFI